MPPETVLLTYIAGGTRPSRPTKIILSHQISFGQGRANVQSS